MDLDEYVKLFKEGRKNSTPITDLFGRILKGKSPNDFLSLSHNPDRKIVMLMQGGGLEKLLGKSGFEALKTIGYKLKYVKYMLENNYTFKLIIIKDWQLLKIATWENVIYLIEKIYPDIVDKIKLRLHELKTTPFHKIQNMVDFDMEKVDNIGPNHPNYMTYQRFKKSNYSLVDIRAFLYHTIKLRALFSGDGYTHTEDGKCGVIEYFLAPNLPLTSLKKYRLINLDINICDI
ncbi:MAG: hypothetical protein ACTSPY_17775 [Candidatus Helarchaeota archaeon]